MNPKIATIGIAAAAMLATPAAAENINAASPEKIASLLQSAGYKASLDTDPTGDPLIRSAASGATFSVFFYGCEKNENCTSIQFYAGWTLDDDLKVDVANTWNIDTRLTKAAIDKEGDPILRMDVLLGTEGIPSELLEQYVSLWDTSLGDFVRHVRP